MNVEIVKFDNLGRGIGYINDKIIFVPKTVPGDIVNLKIISEKKNYYEGILLEIIKPSKFRITPVCSYFNKCGGCDLMHISLTESLEYKLNKINEMIQKNRINYDVTDIIKSDFSCNYRNKVTLKIVDGNVGYFENNTHILVKINYCYLCMDTINKVIKDIHLLNINNGEVVIRTNYNNEILINVMTMDEIKNIDSLMCNHKIVGIIKNDECIYGENYFIDKINNYLFKVSYNSFFQVNPFICSKLFDLIEKHTFDSKKVIDLYCGVGTLSIVASKNASYVLGVEIVSNAILDANLNKNLNQKNNLEFLCADTKKVVDKISNEYDTLILDPPRSGVSKTIIDKIKIEKIKKVIYVSCNPSTLIRDLKLFEDSYTIKEFKLMDMFPNSEHIESFVVLKFNN